MYYKNEKGIALLYVLGILALLTVMALAFMNSSIFDQRAMAHSSAGSVAENLALATMEKVVYAIQDATVVKSDEDTVSYMPDDHYQTSGTGTTNEYIPEDQNALKNLNTFDYFGKSKIYVFDWEEFKKENKQDDDIRWILHRVKIGEKGGNDIYEVIGRTAFVVHPLGKSQLDPASLVKFEVDENLTEENRRGQDISEINILDIKKPLGPNSVFQGRGRFFNYTNNGASINGRLPISGSWTSTTNLLTEFSVAYPALSTGEQDTIGEFANDFFVCDPGAVLRDEKYVMNYEDASGNPLKHYLHRFYLPRFEDKKDSTIQPERRDGIFKSGAPDNETNFWDNLDINDKILLSPPTADPHDVGVDLFTENGVKWNDDDAALATLFDADADAIGKGIQWLANFGYNDEGNLLKNELKGTFGNILHRRQQIAANLKDYCDSDDVPTSDVLPTTWTVTGATPVSPLYTGNEETPYLNEFELKLVVSNTMVIIDKTVGMATAYTLKSTVEVDLMLGGEVINIYKNITSFPADTKIEVGHELDSDVTNRQMTVKFDAASGKTGSVDFETEAPPSVIEITYLAPTPDPNHHFKATLNSILKPTNNTVTVETDEVDAINKLPQKMYLDFELKIKLTNALFKYDNKNVDYGKLNKTFRFHGKDIEFTCPTAVVTESDSKMYILSAQVEDPRQNLNSGDWYIMPQSYMQNNEVEGVIDITTGEQTTSKLGNVNEKSNPFAPSFASADYDQGYDKEKSIVTSPAYVDNTKFMSTAYIRNAPMLSPWELGFIHRGKKWQTINLSKYHKEKAVKAHKNSSGNWILPGGGKYVDGDANILDQIKMTPESKGPVKVNLSGKSDEMLNALFANIYLGCLPIEKGDSITNIARDGTLIEAGVINDIISKLKSGNFTTRAGIADILSEKLEKEMKTTKAEQEELIGKVIQLVDIYPSLQMFELIILSQAIKDIGVPTAHNEKITIRKSYYDGSVFQTTNPIDAYIGEINWDKSAGVIADEVLAQRKLRVRGYRDSTSGKVQLISIKTLE